MLPPSGQPLSESDCRNLGRALKAGRRGWPFLLWKRDTMLRSISCYLFQYGSHNIISF